MINGTSRSPLPRAFHGRRWVVHGLLFGPALGMLLALVFAGPDALALGLVFGAGLGVVVGAVLEAQRNRRRQ